MEDITITIEAQDPATLKVVGTCEVTLSADAEEIFEAAREQFGLEAYLSLLPGEFVPGYLENIQVARCQQMDLLTDYAEKIAEAVDNGMEAKLYTAICSEWEYSVDPDVILIRGESGDPAKFAQDFVDDLGGVVEAIGPDRIESYIDWDYLGRELLHDFYEIAGFVVEVDA